MGPGSVCQHLTVARVADGLGVAWNTANDAVLAEGRHVLIGDGLAVTTQVLGDRADRPPLELPGVCVDVFLPCQHQEQGTLRVVSVGRRPPLSKGLAFMRRSHTGGELQ
jgi:hypothetical protein